MGRFIKYERETKIFINPDDIQEHLDSIIERGCEIVYYNEEKTGTNHDPVYKVTLILGKLNIY